MQFLHKTNISGTERQFLMSNVKDFLKRKDIVITPQRYLIEALGAMAQGLFASLLIGTIIKTVGQQTGLALLVDLGGYATAMSGPAMACAIGWALHCPPLVLFSLITVGYSANALGGAGGPLAVLIIAIVAAELGKAVSKETKVDILVTPLVTIFVGVGLSMLIAAPIGAAASQVGTLIMWATEQAPLVMGILVSVIVGVALTLPISSAAICAALGLTGLAGRWMKLGDEPLRVCDTGHNPGGWHYLSSQIAGLHGRKHIIVGFVGDKDVEEIMREIARYNSGARFYFTAPSSHRRLPEDELFSIARSAGLYGRTFASVTEAYEKALAEAGKGDSIFVGGSNYVIGELLASLRC